MSTFDPYRSPVATDETPAASGANLCLYRALLLLWSARLAYLLVAIAALGHLGVGQGIAVTEILEALEGPGVLFSLLFAAAAGFFLILSRHSGFIVLDGCVLLGTCGFASLVLSFNQFYSPAWRAVIAAGGDTVAATITAIVLLTVVAERSRSAVAWISGVALLFLWTSTISSALYCLSWAYGWTTPGAAPGTDPWLWGTWLVGRVTLPVGAIALLPAVAWTRSDPEPGRCPI